MGNLLCCSKSQHLESSDFTEELKREGQIDEIEDLKQPAVIDIDEEHVKKFEDVVIEVSPSSDALTIDVCDMEKGIALGNDEVSEHSGGIEDVYSDTEATENPIPKVSPLSMLIHECQNMSNRKTEDDSYQNINQDTHGTTSKYNDDVMCVVRDALNTCCIDLENETSYPEVLTKTTNELPEEKTACSKYIDIVADENQFCTEPNDDFGNNSSDLDEHLVALTETKEIITLREDEGVNLESNTITDYKHFEDVVEVHDLDRDFYKTIDDSVPICDGTSDNVKYPPKDNLDADQHSCQETSKAEMYIEQLANIINENRKLMNEINSEKRPAVEYAESEKRSTNIIRREDSIRPSFLPKRQSPLVISDIPSMANTDTNPTEQEEDARSYDEKPSEEETRQLNKERLEELSRDNIKPRLKLIEYLIDDDYQEWPTSEEKVNNKEYRHGTLAVLKEKRQEAYKNMVKEHAEREGAMMAMEKQKERVAIDAVSNEDIQRPISPVLPIILNQTTEQTSNYIHAGGRRFTKEEKCCGHVNKEMHDDVEERYISTPDSDSERKEVNELEENREGWPPPAFMFETLRQKRLATERALLMKQQPEEANVPEKTIPAPIQRRFSFLPIDQRSDSSEESVSTIHSYTDEQEASPIQRHLSFLPGNDRLDICRSENTTLGAPSWYTCNTASVECLPAIQTDKDASRSSLSNQSFNPVSEVGVSRSLCGWTERGNVFASSTSKPLLPRMELPAIGATRSGNSFLTKTLPAVPNGNRSRPPFSFSNHLTNAALQNTLLEATTRLRNAVTKVSADDLHRLEVEDSNSVSPSPRSVLPAIRNEREIVNTPESAKLSRHKSHRSLDKM